MTEKPQEAQRCSFCQRDSGEVERLIAGPDNVCICNICVELCQHMLAEDDARTDLQPEPEHSPLRPPPRDYGPPQRVRRGPDPRQARA